MKLVGCALVSTLSMFAAGCGGDDGGDDFAPVAETYAANVYANYSDTVAKAEALKTAVDAFIANPTQATMDAAKQAWLDSREPYLQTEVYRFYDGPIDNPEDGPEGEVNSWPLDEVFIDYVVGMPDAGIINDKTTFPMITVDVIKEQNENGGEANISAGYHAIEFLLWGQDLSDTGPGARPVTDYVMNDPAGTNQGRRRTYLQLVTQLLVDDMTQVRDQWAPDQQNYRADFVAGGKDSIRKILLGMGSLSGAELSGERMTVALDNRDQEDEHSCFSDNTHRDLYGNALGIQNVYLGTYGANHGKGIDDLVRAKDVALADKLKMQIAASVAAIQAIPHPFDQAIKDDTKRPLIMTAIQDLQTQTETTVEAATALGITINLQ
ncbi:MAG: iron-regulated protein [Kofleriaceae bacterium]|nr:iron-regulated protein [Kofleriaceae bacterium]